MGDVLRFPVIKKCDDCEHAAFSSHGIYCLFFNEEIYRSATAEDCEEFLPLSRYTGKVIS